MSLVLNSLQVRKAKFDSTKMTDYNHWSKMRAIKPTVFDEAHRTLFASKTNSLNLTGGNILESIFGLSKTKYIDDLNWSWKIQAQGYRPITILENRTIGDEPGKNRQPIKVLVDVDLAQIGESWTPGSSDKSQVVVVTEKVKEGARGYVYTLKTYTDSDSHFINPEYLSAGTKWTRFYTMRGEAAESGGYGEMTTDIEFKNQLVKLRKEYHVTDFAAQAVLQIAFKDEQGRVFNSWMDWQEAMYHAKMNKEVALNAMYSRLSDAPLIDPDAGTPINPGAGIQQQIAFGGNVEGYTTLTAELIEAFFDKIVYSRISPGDLGEVIGFSGHYGMKEFAKALDEWTKGRSIVRESATHDKRTDPKGVHNNSLRAGYQYTLYDLPNGGSFKLIHNPLNDDKEIHRDIDPLTGYPLESQRITILDVTGGNGMSISANENICLVKKNKVAGTTIVEGRVGPGGVSTGNNAKHSGDYYRVDISDSVGVQITDPTITGELVKRVN
jgi:hypothetical protein